MSYTRYKPTLAEKAERLIKEGVPTKIVILHSCCPAADTYIGKDGKLRRRPEYDDGSRYWEHPEGREI